RTLLTEFVNKLLLLAKDDIYIRNFYTDVYTNEGEKLAKHFGFKKIRKSLDGHIYKMSLLPPEFISVFPKNVKKLKKIYSDRFKDYQNLIDTSWSETTFNDKVIPDDQTDKFKYSIGLSFSGNERE